MTVHKIFAEARKFAFFVALMTTTGMRVWWQRLPSHWGYLIKQRDSEVVEKKSGQFTFRSRRITVVRRSLVGAHESDTAQTQALILFFIAAIVKALLAARKYMHLKNEKAIIFAMALAPLAFDIISPGRFLDFVRRLTKS